MQTRKTEVNTISSLLNTYRSVGTSKKKKTPSVLVEMLKRRSFPCRRRPERSVPSGVGSRSFAIVSLLSSTSKNSFSREGPHRPTLSHAPPDERRRIPWRSGRVGFSSGDRRVSVGVVGFVFYEGKRESRHQQVVAAFGRG